MIIHKINFGENRRIYEEEVFIKCMEILGKVTNIIMIVNFYTVKNI